MLQFGMLVHCALYNIVILTVCHIVIWHVVTFVTVMHQHVEIRHFDVWHVCFWHVVIRHRNISPHEQIVFVQTETNSSFHISDFRAKFLGLQKSSRQNFLVKKSSRQNFCS
jgi:hypothetical protein